MKNIEEKNYSRNGNVSIWLYRLDMKYFIHLIEYTQKPPKFHFTHRTTDEQHKKR